MSTIDMCGLKSRSLFQALPTWLRQLFLYLTEGTGQRLVPPAASEGPKTMTIDEVMGLTDYANRYPFANTGC
jgi:hypothetical protein